MKPFAISLTFIFLLSSCASTESIYYQLYKTQPTLQTEAENFVEDEMRYEDRNCIIRYNFWNEGGDAGFAFTNKTDSVICINKARSYYVLNGIANDYYTGRSIANTNSSEIGVSSGVGVSASITGITRDGYIGQRGVSQGVSIGTLFGKSETETLFEREDVCIPPHSSKIISQYSIFERPIRYCNLIKYPDSKTTDKVSFTEETSPIRFGNRITYNIDGSAEVHAVTHEFFVTEVVNYPKSGFVKTKEIVNCDPKDRKRSAYEIEYTPYYSESRFFNEYNSSNPRFDSTLVEVFDALK